MTLAEIEAALRGAIDGFRAFHGSPPEGLVVSPATLQQLSAEWLSDGWQDHLAPTVKYHGVLLVSDPYLPAGVVALPYGRLRHQVRGATRHVRAVASIAARRARRLPDVSPASPAP